MSTHSVCLKFFSLGMAPCTVSTFWPARGPKAMRYVHGAACSGLSARASSETPSLSLSATYVRPSSSTNTPRRVSSFISRVMMLCNTDCSASSVGVGASTNSAVPSALRRYTPFRTRQ